MNFSTKKLLNIIWQKLTTASPSVREEIRQWNAKLTAFMVLVIIFGVSLNLLLGEGLGIYVLIPLFIAYFSAAQNIIRLLPIS